MMGVREGGQGKLKVRLGSLFWTTVVAPARQRLAFKPSPRFHWMLVQVSRCRAWSKAIQNPQKCRQRKDYRGIRFYSTSNEQAGDKLKILFLGRDEFSSLVLQELYSARGAL